MRLLGRFRPFATGLAALACLMLFAPPRALGQDDTGYYFMQLPASARAAATANGIISSASSNVQQFLYNPAALSEKHHRQVSLSYINHVSDLNFGGVAYGHRLSNIGSLGAAVRFLGYGDIARTNAEGEAIGSFGASDVAVSVGLGRVYGENLRIGAAGHLISSSIDDARASAVAVDAGVLYEYRPFELTLGASVNHLGTELSGLGQSSTRLPLDVRLYAAKQLEYVPVLLSVTGYRLHALGTGTGSVWSSIVRDHLRFGGALQLGSTVELRFGYNPRHHEAMSMKSRMDLAGLSLGFGLELFRISFDYAYESWSSFGGLHFLTVGTTL